MKQIINFAKSDRSSDSEPHTWQIRETKGVSSVTNHNFSYHTFQGNVILSHDLPQVVLFWFSCGSCEGIGPSLVIAKTGTCTTQFYLQFRPKEAFYFILQAPRSALHPSVCNLLAHVGYTASNLLWFDPALLRKVLQAKCQNLLISLFSHAYSL